MLPLFVHLCPPLLYLFLQAMLVFHATNNVLMGELMFVTEGHEEERKLRVPLCIM